MYSRKVIAIVCFLGSKVCAMEPDLRIIAKDAQKNMFQIESLNQLDNEQGELAKTACGYYALDNCIEIMKTFVDKKSDGLSTVIKQFETVDSEQRRAIFIKRLIVQLQDFVKVIMQQGDFSRSTDKTAKDNAIVLVRLILQDVANSSDPFVKDGSIGWTFKEDDLCNSYQRVCKSYGGYALSFKPLVQGFEKNGQSLPANPNGMSAAVWRRISEKSKTSLSFKEGLLSFSFDPQSEVCKHIAYGNWLDAEDIGSLIELFNKQRDKKFELGVLNMGGNFDSYVQDCVRNSSKKKNDNEADSAAKKNDAISEKKNISADALINEYEYVNYHLLKTIKLKLATTNEDVVAGFVIHTTTTIPSVLSWLSSLISTKEMGAHWISLVIVRLQGGPIQYYLADSLANENRLDSIVIGDIIAYVEDWEPRKGSQFDIPDPEELSIVTSEKADTVVAKRMPSRQRIAKGGGQKAKEQSSLGLSPQLALGILGLGGLVLARSLQREDEKKIAPLTKKNSTKEKTDEKDDVFITDEPLSVAAQESSSGVEVRALVNSRKIAE